MFCRRRRNSINRARSLFCFRSKRPFRRSARARRFLEYIYILIVGPRKTGKKHKMAGNRNKIMPRSFDKNRSNLTNYFPFFCFFGTEEEDLFFLRQEEETQAPNRRERERERVLKISKRRKKKDMTWKLDTRPLHLSRCFNHR